MDAVLAIIAAKDKNKKDGKSSTLTKQELLDLAASVSSSEVSEESDGEEVNEIKKRQ